MPADVVAAARTVCERFGGGVQKAGGIPAVATLIGVAEGTLYNKLSGSEDSHHKLTVRDLILIFLATKDLLPLRVLAKTMGCVCFPVPDYTGLADDALLDLMNKVHEEGGQFHGVLRHALEDGRIDGAEYAQLKREGYQWIGAIAEALARLEALADA